MRRLAIVLLLVTGPLSVPAADAPKPQAYALLVSGESGEAQFATNYLDWMKRLYKVATDSGIPAANVRVLMEKKALAPFVNDISTKENFEAAFKAQAARLKPGDQFFVALIGHGTNQNNIGKFCLPGPHLTSVELGKMLGTVPTREVILVDATSSGGAFLETASAPGHVLITATSNPAEGNETYFMEFFLQAYENKAAAPAGSGVVDLLSAFNYASTHCLKWYLRQYYSKDRGAWRIEGRQSRQLWQKFYGKLPDKHMLPPSDPKADDAEPVVGDWGEQWANRRMTTEHAQLDDNGDKQGATVFDNRDFTPLTGAEEGSEGKLARQTVLGRPRGDFAPPAPPVAESPKAQP